jgi:multiple sugar transport system ATP-binding protein
MHGGVVEQVGQPVEIYNHPATRFVGGFIGNPPMNFIKVPVSNGEVTAGAERLVAPGESGNEVILGLRGEAVELAPLPQGLEMRVRVAEPMGSHLLLTGSIHDQPVRVILPASETVKSGETIGLKLDQKRITWLSPESGKSFPAVLA